MHIFNIFLIQNWFSKEQIVIHAISCPCFTIIPFISCVWRYFMRIKLAKTGCCWLICVGMSGSYNIFLNDLIWWLTFIVAREKLKEKSRNKDIISSSSGRVQVRFDQLICGFRVRFISDSGWQNHIQNPNFWVVTLGYPVGSGFAGLLVSILSYSLQIILRCSWASNTLREQPKDLPLMLNNGH